MRLQQLRQREKCPRIQATIRRYRADRSRWPDPTKTDRKQNRSQARHAGVQVPVQAPAARSELRAVSARGPEPAAPDREPVRNPGRSRIQVLAHAERVPELWPQAAFPA